MIRHYYLLVVINYWLFVDGYLPSFILSSIFFFLVNIYLSTSGCAGSLLVRGHGLSLAARKAGLLFSFSGSPVGEHRF